MKKAVVVYGGWDGHEPEKIANRFNKFLSESGFEVTMSDSLTVFEDLETLKKYDLIVPVWTMGEITETQCNNVSEAIAEGTGIAGCHGGMCDAFRNSVLWQFITGGNWVSHPGGDGVEYTVEITDASSELVNGIGNFKVTSEQYYLHVDPAVKVLATTRFPIATWYHSSNEPVDMPIAWTKKWGLGHVYYNSLGHHNDIFDIPEAMDMMSRGLIWASEGKERAAENSITADIYRSTGKMF
ncbi:MAG: ThuA domain-containing protein [Spirochaetaceae bacterium]